MAGMQGGLKSTASTAQSRARGVMTDVDLAKAYRDLGIRLHQQRRFAEAETYSRAALRLRPDDIDVLNELALAVWRQGRTTEAEAIYRQACVIKPDDFRILTNLGVMLYDQDRVDEAGESYRQALQHQPTAFTARMNLGVVLSDQGRFDEAMDCLNRAYQLRPESAEVLHNLGMNHFRVGKTEKAIDYYEQALRHRPDFAEGHRDLAFALLCRGDYVRGWHEYEWRLRCQHYAGCGMERPFWNGDELRGKTILIHAEQGYGDTLQFLRFAPMVKERGGWVVVRCPTPLLQLVARCDGVDLAYDGNSYEPPYHTDVAFMSLPARFGTTLATLPTRVPYLATDPMLVEHWRSELARVMGTESAADSEDRGRSGEGRPTRPFLVGIVWQGNPEHCTDRWRSFPLAQFAPLAALPGVRLISLQTVHGLDQLANLRGRMPITELTARRGRDFIETASIMSHLDLVITADTAVAHLAGGLGFRVWIALSSVSEWRWPAGREDNAWYPTMKVFRQTTFGDWDSVFRRITNALKKEVEKRC
jgi:Flp pilus assembly protein TadD